VDLWAKLLDPLRVMVPCEDVKIVVHSPRGVPMDAMTGPFDPEVRNRMKAAEPRTPLGDRPSNSERSQRRLARPLRRDDTHTNREA